LQTADNKPNTNFTCTGLQATNRVIIRAALKTWRLFADCFLACNLVCMLLYYYMKNKLFSPRSNYNVPNIHTNNNSNSSPGPLITFSKLLLQILIVSLVLLVVPGCASTKRLFNVSNIDITLKAAKDVNIDNNGIPTPIAVKFYELTEIKDFRSADFATIYNDEQSSFGKYIVKRDEFELKPGEEREIDRVAKRNTRYIGIVAAYNDVDNAKWRTIISIRKDGTDLVVHLGKTGMWASKY
jgi:type VI secretion system protein VasD